MKVIFIPYWGNKNPYQPLLSKELKKLGIDVKNGIVYRKFSIIRNIIKFWEPDIVHIHWLHPLAIENTKVKTIIKSVDLIIELLILKILKIRIVWTVHNLKNHENRQKEVELFFTRILAILSDSVIVHCKFAKFEIIKKFNIKNKNKITIIPHGNYIGYYKNNISKTEARHKLGISPTKIVYLFIGLIRKYKGIPNLIKSYKKLNYRNSILIIAGKPYDKKIVHLIEKEINNDKNIKFILKFIPADEIQIYINASDILIFPYSDILTSSGVVLGMSFKKAIIAPRIGCINEILDNRGGFLYNPSDNEGLLDSMRQLLTKITEIREMGEHNYKLAEGFTWKMIAGMTCEVYRKFINR